MFLGQASYSLVTGQLGSRLPRGKGTVAQEAAPCLLGSPFYTFCLLPMVPDWLPNPVEFQEAPPNSTVTLTSQRHAEKLPEVTGTSRWNPGFPASTQERPRESFLNAS